MKGDYLSFAEMANRIHESDTQLEEAVEQLLDGQITSFDQEFRMRHQDGHYVWLRARVALAPGEAEDHPHLMGIVFDISQQKLADKLNKEAELRLMDAIENISEAFVLWDADNRLVLCNSKYQQFHSLPAAVCVPGTPYEDVVRSAKEPAITKRTGIRGEGGDGRSFEVQLADRRWLQINERRTKDGGFLDVGDVAGVGQHRDREIQAEVMRNGLITGRRVRAHSGGDPGDNEPGCVAMYKWNAAEKRFTKHLLADGGPGTGLQIRVADLDGNGWKDIICAGKSGTHILWNAGR